MSSTLRKIIDIGPGGVIYPGSAQDLRYAQNLSYFSDTRTRWIRFWADWPSLQPHPDYAPDDPRSPGAWKLQALDEQIRLANANGIKVMLMPYRFPTWVNGTSTLSAQKNTDAEISFRPADRMTKAAWDRYVRSGRDPAAYSPSRRALEYLLPDDAYGPTSAWATFFDFLYRRYHYGQRASGRWVDGFELVNEPNLQLWPQQAASADPADAWATSATSIEAAIARLLKTAQGISSRYAHSTMLYAPSVSDSDTASSRLYTRYDEFVPRLLDALAATGYLVHSRQAWSHHNYTDVEKRQTSTRTQLIRGAAQGPLVGLQQRPVADGLRDRGRRAALADAGALSRRRIRARPRRSACATRGRCTSATAAPGPAWRCSRSTCSTPTPTSTAVCSTRTRAR